MTHEATIQAIKKACPEIITSITGELPTKENQEFEVRHCITLEHVMKTLDKKTKASNVSYVLDMAGNFYQVIDDLISPFPFIQCLEIKVDLCKPFNLQSESTKTAIGELIGGKGE